MLPLASRQKSPLGVLVAGGVVDDALKPFLDAYRPYPPHFIRSPFALWGNCFRTWPAVNNNNGLLLPLLMFHSKCDKDKGNFLLSVLWPGKCFAPAQPFFSAHISHKSKWRPYQFKLIRRCLLPLWHALETSPTEGGGFMGVRERERVRFTECGGEKGLFGTPFSARLCFVSFQLFALSKLTSFWVAKKQKKIWKSEWRREGVVRSHSPF